jgi:altronate hydrolase
MRPSDNTVKLAPAQVPPLSPVIRLGPRDDVLIARHQLIAGTRIAGENLTAVGLIPAGHKIAGRAIRAGEMVRRYDQIIGMATTDIEPGQHVHSHNLAMVDYAREPVFGSAVRAVDYVAEPAQFMGIVRADGRVATRNYIGILTSVNCSATVARAIADHFRRDIHPEALADHPQIDGVIALTHGLGCGIDSGGEGLQVLRRTLAGYATHANFAAILIVGLGCETNQIGSLMRTRGLEHSERLQSFTIQDTGGTAKTVARGIATVRDMLAAADPVRRVPVPVGHLVVGLQCGGSDGYSGISANPALGAAVDLLVRHGGTAILSETPEIYGAEHLLASRAVSPAVGEKLISRVRWWEDYCRRNHAELNNNPSAGNKIGGLTTILEKSLGAVAKGGTTPLMDVYEYAEEIRSRGLVFMDTPGYDPVSATGQVAGGANMICFTTGRGSAYGCAPSPSIKLSTNSALWQRQEEDIDINCGTLLDGTATVQQLGEEIFACMIACASGRASKSELHGYGQSEFLPWQIGVIT